MLKTSLSNLQTIINLTIILYKLSTYVKFDSIKGP